MCLSLDPNDLDRMTATYSPVLETDRHGQGRSQLSVDLRFRRPGADGSPTGQFCSELVGDGICHSTILL